MEALTLEVGQVATYVGVQPVDRKGNPAKLDTSDQPITVVTESGDGVGAVTNVNEETGSFDLVITAGAPGASVLSLKGDAASAEGEVNEITLEINLTTKALEASGFTLPEPVITDLEDDGSGEGDGEPTV